MQATPVVLSIWAFELSLLSTSIKDKETVKMCTQRMVKWTSESAVSKWILHNFVKYMYVQHYTRFFCMPSFFAALFFLKYYFILKIHMYYLPKIFKVFVAFLPFCFHTDLDWVFFLKTGLLYLCGIYFSSKYVKVPDMYLKECYSNCYKIWMFSFTQLTHHHTKWKECINIHERKLHIITCTMLSLWARYLMTNDYKTRTILSENMKLYL